MKLDPLQELVAKAVKANNEKAPPFCLLCGQVEKKGRIGAYMPRTDDDKAYAATTGRLRVWLYFCCAYCATRPDCMKRVEVRIHSSNRVRSIEVQLPKGAFQIN